MIDGASPTPHEPLLTPANLMTLARPLIGLEIGRKLLAGEMGVTPLMLTMAATDGEGFVARYIDKHFPDSGRGSTELGKAADPIADTIAFAEVATAALKAPRVSRLGKTAVGIVLVSESIKGVWATYVNLKHRAATGEQLVITPSRLGKTATASKFAALTAAVATSDLEPGRKRTVLGWAAIGTALSGACLGEKARQGYRRELQS